LGGLLILKQTLGPLLPDGVPPGRSDPGAVGETPPPLRTRGPSGFGAEKIPLLPQVADYPALGHEPSALLVDLMRRSLYLFCQP
jgi:hypothetical protein